MHGGPSIGAVANIRGDTLLAREGDDAGDEAMFAGAVDGRGKPHDRRANPSPDEVSAAASENDRLGPVGM